MKSRCRINDAIAAALAACLVMATPARADSPPLDPGARPSDASATANPEASGSAKDATADDPQCGAFAADRDADVGDIIRAGCKPTTAQMSRLMDNPLGNVAMLFTQFDFYQLKDPNTGRTEDKYNYMGIAQFPKGLGENWNLINRIVWNVPSMPLSQSKIDRADNLAGSQYGELQGAITPPTGANPLPIDLFPGRTTGFGDMFYVGLFSPKKPIDFGAGKIVWGAGFDVMAPTASEDILGTGKWGAGPSALGVYLGSKWKLGALVQQYWDFAGDSDRDNVNLMNLQYFYMYSLNDTTSIGAAPNIIANFEQSGGNQWTVPIGLGINKTINIGKVPVRFGIEAYYSAIRPNDVVGTEWNYRFYVIPAAPSALFQWMR